MAASEQLEQFHRDLGARVERALADAKQRLLDRLREAQEQALREAASESVSPELIAGLVPRAALEELERQLTPPPPPSPPPPPAPQPVLAAPAAQPTDLRDAVRAIDAAPTQVALLEALLRGALHFADRAALFLINTAGNRGWASTTANGEVVALDQAELGAASAALDQLRSGQGTTVLAAADCAPFAALLEGASAPSGLLVPLVLRDRLAAALYVDRAAAPPDLAALQLLVFAAAQGLELQPLRGRAMTSTLFLHDEVAELPALQPWEDQPAEAAAAAPPVDEELAAPESLFVEDAGLAVAPTELPPIAPPPVEPAPPEPVVEPPPLASWTPPEIEIPPAAVLAPAPVEPPRPAPTPWLIPERAPVIAPPPAPQMPEEDLWQEEEVAAEPAPLPASALVSDRPVDEITATLPRLEAPGPFDLPAAPPPIEVGEDETVMLSRPVAVPAPAPAPEPITAALPVTPAPPPPVTPFSPVPAEPRHATPRPAPRGAEVKPPDDLQGPGWAFSASRTVLSGEQAMHEEARRLARLLISEIKLYNEDRVEEGRRRGNIYHQLRDDIDRSRQIYDERVPEKVRDATDYFRDEMVRTLAGGDARLLGQ